MIATCVAIYKCKMQNLGVMRTIKLIIIVNFPHGCYIATSLLNVWTKVASHRPGECLASQLLVYYDNYEVTRKCILYISMEFVNDGHDIFSPYWASQGLVYTCMIVGLHHISLRLLTQQCEITTILQSLVATITTLK